MDTQDEKLYAMKLDMKQDQTLRSEWEYFNQMADEACGVTAAITELKKMCDEYGYDFREHLDYILEGV